MIQLEQKEKCDGASSQGLTAKEGENAKPQYVCDDKKVSPRETENRRGITIIEEPIQGYAGPSPHEFLDSFFIPIRGAR